MTKPSVAPIEGRRIRLRLLRQDDLAMTLAWRNQDHIRRWFIHSNLLTLDQHCAWFARYELRDNDFLFVLEETATLHKPIGQIGLYDIDRSRRVAEFGRLLIGEADARGQGLAREATSLLLNYGFEAWGLQEVYLEVYEENRSAIAIYQRCGFTVSGKANGLLQMRANPSSYGVAAEREGTPRLAG